MKSSFLVNSEKESLIQAYLNRCKVSFILFAFAVDPDGLNARSGSPENVGVQVVSDHHGIILCHAEEFDILRGKTADKLSKKA